MAVKGVVYDVGSARNMYGPGGSYHLFAGRECARALAILSLKEEDCNGNLSDLTEEQVKKLDEWVAKFEAKYPVVGRLV